jgi:Protein of unknown function (DUF3551)
MRNRFFCLAAGAVLATTLLGTAGPASADPYKWCAAYGGMGGGGGTNCGFLTLEQCRATVSGIGGSCEQNRFYTGPDDKPTRRARRQSQN